MPVKPACLYVCLFVSVLVCVSNCVSVCVSEAVDLSTPQHCPVTRVLPPPRPQPSTPRPLPLPVPHLSLAPPLSLAPDRQPTLKPSPTAAIQRSPMLTDHQAVLKQTVLPSVVEQAAFKPLTVTRSLAPHSAHSANPQLSLGPHQQLDMAGQMVSSRSGQQTFPADKLSADETAKKGQNELQVDVSDSTADITAATPHTSGQQTSLSEQTSLPDDLSTKQTLTDDKLSAETATKMEEHGFVRDDSSPEKSVQPMLQADNLSVEIRKKPSVHIADRLSTKQPVLPDAVSVKSQNKQPSTDTRRELSFVADSLPTTPTLQPNDLSTDMKKQESSLLSDVPVSSTESTLERAVVLGEHVNAADQTCVTTSTSVCADSSGQWKFYLFN